jgi:NTP pyrophosphatase (non-canonical NTP hydrolase)
MDLSNFQKIVADKFADKDCQMGPQFMTNVLVEEVGELSRAIRKESVADISEEIADVIFSSISIANLFNIDVSTILKEKYVDRSISEISRKWSDVNWK